MTQVTIHVAIFDNQRKGDTERITIQRRVDGVILVYPFEEEKSVFSTLERYKNLGMEILTVPVDPNDFHNILSHILEALDDYCIDSQKIEFSIVCQNPILALAACFASIIVQAPIYSMTDSDLSKIVEINSSKITTLTVQKRRILEIISEHPGSVNQRHITQEIQLSNSNVSRHIKTLAKAGYVKCYREGRQKYIQITTLGSTVLRHKLLRKRRIWGTPNFQPTEVYSSVG
jgi:DNA-binding MarR family transcriptional regulator